MEIDKSLGKIRKEKNWRRKGRRGRKRKGSKKRPGKNGRKNNKTHEIGREKKIDNEYS